MLCAGTGVAVPQGAPEMLGTYPEPSPNALNLAARLITVLRIANGACEINLGAHNALETNEQGEPEVDPDIKKTYQNQTSDLCILVEHALESTATRVSPNSTYRLLTDVESKKLSLSLIDMHQRMIEIISAAYGNKSNDTIETMSALEKRAVRVLQAFEGIDQVRKNLNSKEKLEKLALYPIEMLYGTVSSLPLLGFVLCALDPNEYTEELAKIQNQHDSEPWCGPTDENGNKTRNPERQKILDMQIKHQEAVNQDINHRAWLLFCDTMINWSESSKP